MASTTTATPSSADDAPPVNGWDAATRARIWSIAFGGRPMTRRMCEGASIGAGSRVVDLGPGMGITADVLNSADLHSYTAVCADPIHADIVSARAHGPARATVVASTTATGLADAEATAVIGECVLTGCSASDRAAVLTEAARLVRPGFSMVFHELALGDDPWRNTDSVADELAAAGLHPCHEAEWRGIIQAAGLEVAGVSRGPVEMPGLLDLVRAAGRAHLRQVAPALLAPTSTTRQLRRALYLMESRADRLESVVLVARRPVLARGRAGAAN